MPLDGCPPQPGAPAVAGRLFERSKGKDTTTGHWEMMGVVTPTAFPTYPHGFPDDVIDPFMNQTGRGVLGNKPASGTEIIQELGEEHQRDGEVDRLHVGGLGLPDRGARGDDSARGALRRLSRRPRDPHGTACGRSRHRATVRRRARQLRAHAEPPRLLARAAPAQLPHVGARRGQHRVRRREDLGHLRRLRRRRLVPDELERRRDQPDDRAARERRRGARLREPRRDGHALGPSQRSRELPPLPPGLRPSAPGHPRDAAGGRPPRHHVGSRLRSDHGVDRPLARARRCSSRTRRDGTPPAGSTRRASSPTSARP